MGKGPGPAPDYMAIAQQQSQASQQMQDAATQANRPNQYTQWGSSTWAQDPTTGQWSQNQVLNPAQQQALNSQFGIQGGLLGQAYDQLGNVQSDMANSNPWQNGSLTSWGQAPQASDQARSDAENAAYNSATSRLDPQWQKAADEKRNQLYAMGLKEGNPTFDTEMQSFQRGQNDAYQQAQNAAVGQGLNAYGQSFNQALSGAGFQNTERAQQVGEAGQQAGWSLGNLQRLISGMGVGQQQFGSTPGATAGAGQTPDMMNAAAQQYAAQVGAANSANSLTGNILGAIGTVGGAMVGGPAGAAAGGAAGKAVSDIRAKDITGSGEAELEDFLHSAEGSRYEYRDEWKSDPEAGDGTYVSPMAQALRSSKLGHEFVEEAPDGSLRVDYGKGLGTLTAAVAHVNKKLNRLERENG